MAEQIECVGGPLCGMVSTKKPLLPEDGGFRYLDIKGDHIYTYNPTTNTYEYKGVRK